MALLSSLTSLEISLGVAAYLDDATPLATACRSLRCVAHFDSYRHLEQLLFCDRCDDCECSILVQVARHTHERRGGRCYVRYWDADDRSYSWCSAARRGEGGVLCDRCLPMLCSSALP